MKLIVQTWRVTRLFAVAFVAQIVQSGPTHLTKKVILAAGVGAIEAVYRQVVPAGKTDGFWVRLWTAYKQVTAAAGKPAAPAVDLPGVTAAISAMIPTVGTAVSTLSTVSVPVSDVGSAPPAPAFSPAPNVV